jgi:cupin 2 domain-containing protein
MFLYVTAAHGSKTWEDRIGSDGINGGACTSHNHAAAEGHRDAINDFSIMQNLFSSIPAILPGELIETLLKAKHVRIERIVSQGHASPAGFWYDQEQQEFVVVLQGAARLTIEGEEPVELVAGDCFQIPPHRRHRVEWTTPDEPTIWLAVLYD